jgi:hypothetical protein
MAALYSAGRPALKNFVAALTVFVTDGEQTGETGETGVFANTAYRCRRLCCALARYPGIWHTGGKENPMSTITFDTLEFTRKLRDAGFDEKQAETVVRVIADAQGQLVTKTDLQIELAPIKADLLLLKWMMGGLIALAISNFAKQFF